MGTRVALAWLPLYSSLGGQVTTMMGIKERTFRPLPENVSLEALVPKDDFYRRLEKRLDLSFVRGLVSPLYAKGGRPSIDPEVSFFACN